MSCTFASNNFSSTSPEPRMVDSFINDLLQAVTSDDPSPCTSCEEGTTATSRCRDCSELLCDPCVQAHQRVRLTKDHRILRFAEENTCASSSSGSHSSQTSESPCSSNSGPAAYCEYHHEFMRLYCETCVTAICGECVFREHRGHQMIYIQDAVDGARSQSLQLLADARAGTQAVRESLDVVQKTSEHIDYRAHQASIEIRAFMRSLRCALDDRERELIIRIDSVRTTKNKSLTIQIENLRVALGRLTRITDFLTDTINTSSGYDALFANEKAAGELRQLKAIRSNLAPCEEPHINFIQPDNNVIRALLALGSISTSSQVNIIARPRIPVGEPYYRHFLRSRPIYGVTSPIVVRPPKQSPFLAFGKEGESEGELCRPWGVCCDKLGHIIVADRSNNRIQVFRPDGSFSHKFGEQGTAPGEFDRPAGITVDLMGRIIVADKDNHRIQIFTIEGNFIRTFGEKGGKNGQFNYPWDVATNAFAQIVVSDTRNHRIQLFDSEGQYLCKYGFEGITAMWKHFDSPRGVCFGPNGEVIITDFNNHRLVVVDSTLSNAQFLGCEGGGARQFLRPQGVICDDEGHIIVADSRNNRIQVIDLGGNFLWKFGQHGKSLGELDRPSGICLSPEGKIIVVDFGNNRLQLF